MDIKVEIQPKEIIANVLTPVEPIYGGTKNYENLENLPSINGIEIIGNLTLEKLGIQPQGDYAKRSELPQNVSDLNNDAGYLVQRDLTDYAKLENLPTKVSELENDSDYATISDLPTKTSELENDSDFSYVSDIPTKVSELENDSSYLVRSDIASIDSHVADFDNPHKVLKSQVGLGNVDNTSDADKPLSIAQKKYIDDSYANSNAYTDQKIADLIGGAPESLDTLKEVADAITENQTVIDALNSTVGTKANQAELDTHTGNNTIHITADERTAWNNKYTKPTSGIPKSDLASAVQTSLGKADTALQAHQDISGLATKTELNNHVTDVDNPHEVTKSQVGLGNVDNTSDANKPVSTATRTAIDEAYANANGYTDQKIADLIGGAPTTLDTLKEVADAIAESKDVETALNSAIGTKANQAELDTHTGNDTIHITADERTDWNDANSKKHTHSNKSILDKITQTLLDAWNAAYTHISDTVKHITADERTAWNNKYTKPSGGIPKSDLASAVQTSLGKADTALQAHQDISGKANASEAGYSLAVSGKTVSLKNKAGTVLSSITTQDTNTTYSSKSAASGGTDVSLVTTGEKYTWNNKANASHGNHVPATETANNAKFLRNDNTWQTVTPANIGAAASSHTHSAYVNQNAFSNVVVGSTTVAADSATDTLTLVAGSNVTITPDATNDKITIAATNTTYSAGAGISLSGTTFSNSGVRSIATGGSNGTISVNTNGTSANVAVKGLGSAAYTASSAYLASSNPTGTGSFSLNRKASTTVGTNSFAEGNNTTASGDYSHAEGESTYTEGKGSHAEGYYTTANGDYQHVQGKYNVADTTSAFIIGNGSSDSARSNAMKVDWSGNLEVAGDLKDGSGNTLNGLKTALDSYICLDTERLSGFNISTTGRVSADSTFDLVVAKVRPGMKITASTDVYAFFTVKPTTNGGTSYNNSRTVSSIDNVTVPNDVFYVAYRIGKGADIPKLKTTNIATTLSKAELNYYTLLNGDATITSTARTLTLYDGRKFDSYPGYITFIFKPSSDSIARSMGCIPLNIFKNLATFMGCVYVNNTTSWVKVTYKSDTTVEVSSGVDGTLYLYALTLTTN